MAGEKRRGESDARLEYCYSFLSEAIDLNRNDLSTNIHEGGLGPTFSAMFQPNSPSSFLLYHQEDPGDVSAEVVNNFMHFMNESQLKFLLWS